MEETLSALRNTLGSAMRVRFSRRYLWFQLQALSGTSGAIQVLSTPADPSVPQSGAERQRKSAQWYSQ